MENTVEGIYKSLSKLTDLHRQLLEVVRKEKEVLLQIDLKTIQEVTAEKYSLLQQIQQVEGQRRKLTAQLTVEWNCAQELTLSQMIHRLRSQDLLAAQQFEVCFNTLSELVPLVTAQNAENSRLVESSLKQIDVMKRTIIDQSNPKAGIYSPKGQHLNHSGSSRLLSKEV